MSQTSHKNTPARRLGPEAKKSIALDALSGQVCLRSRDAFWDIQVPKTHSIFDNLLLPRPPCVRAASPHLRKLGAGYAALPQMARRRVRMLALLPLWRYRTTGKQSRLAATGDYAPSLRSPWRAANESFNSDFHATGHTSYIKA